MFLIAPLIAVLAYIYVGYLLVRILFGTNRARSFAPLLILLLIPFVAEEIYKRLIISEFSPICKSLSSSRPIGVNPESSILVLRSRASNPLLAEARIGEVTGASNDAGYLRTEFLAVFGENHKFGELRLLSTKGISQSELCDSNENEHSCGLRTLAERPTVNMLTTIPSSLRFESSYAVRYWVWGDAIGQGEELHYWTRFIKRRGSLKEGGWTFWWPWPGSHELLNCTSNNLTLKEWLVHRRKE